MSGFVGFCNLKKTLNNSNIILKDMNNTLTYKGDTKAGYFESEHVCLGHKKLILLDVKNKPMSVRYGDTTYTIVYNGKIYNADELRHELISYGYEFNEIGDTEVLLKAFVHFGTNILLKLNGIFSFAIWNDRTKELYLVRDHFGIKPLYYAITDNTIVFSTEIKALFKYPGIEPKINSQSICELFGLGPAHTPGLALFKGIYEVQPAHFILFNKSGLHVEKYWELKSRPHTDNFKDTCEKVQYLLNDSINKQLVSDVPLCAMLSGGLDSSIITAYASKHYKSQNMPPLQTFSVDYVDNDKNFVKSDFQPNSDNYYINIMVKEFNTKHHKIFIDTPELADYLEDAMVARDYPGMADVDSSMLLFCKNIKEKATVCLSGECSDEIFAGYPWFFRNDALKSNTFPWSIAIAERQNLLNKDISRKIDLRDYIDYRYEDTLKNVKTLETDSEETADKRKISYLTINWFMQTLLDRADRMAMYSGLEIRVPFCDYRIVEYLWNIPWEMKALNGREKGLLRYVVRDLLPEEIVNRKKSPYPKTHNPNYLSVVKELLIKIMDNPNSPINNLVNKNYILEILKTDGKAFTRPWFGQLMTGPQLIAYLVQINMWLEKYNIKIEI